LKSTKSSRGCINIARPRFGERLGSGKADNHNRVHHLDRVSKENFTGLFVLKTDALDKSACLVNSFETMVFSFEDRLFVVVHYAMTWEHFVCIPINHLISQNKIITSYLPSFYEKRMCYSFPSHTVYLR
jgi:hypothetical protein